MKTRNRVVGRLIVLTVMLLTIVMALIGCNGKNSVNGTIDDADKDSVVTEDGASSNNISANDATNSGTSFVVTEQIDEETPESILLEDFMDTLAANYDHITNMNWGSEPTGMSVEVGNGIKKDILFANGTPIKVLSTKTNLDSYVWDTVLQFKLDNNLDQQNKGAGAVVTGEMTIPDRSLVIGVPGKVVRMLHDDEITRNRENAEHYVSYIEDII